MDARIRPDRLPRHVAVIMDGNGRWAESRGLARTEGHRAGVRSVRSVVRTAHEIGISWLTLFAFSSENWSRPKTEVDVLMKLPEEYFEAELPEVVEKGICISSIGRRDRLPPAVRESLEDAIGRTRHNDGMRLCFALSYGGRAELVDATRRILRDHELGRVEAETLDEKSFAAYLDDPEMPEVDLLIRTGAEYRISNFLLWQAAYAEIVFSDLMWPDFERKDFEEAILEYQSRERRYGLTSAQVRGGRGAP
jgi:undecaprenyl diphosphate synthase